MANPQVENGHIDIANEIVEALAKIRLSGEEMQVLWVILRKTYGWHKKQDNIPLSQFSEMTGLSRQHVLRAINKLLPKKVIAVTKNGYSLPNTYEFNKDFDTWCLLPKKVHVTKNGYKVLPKMDTKLLPKKGHSKEKKETTKEIYLDYLFFTPEEYQKLKTKFNSRLPEILDHMNVKIGQNVAAFNKKYKSHYFTILNWEKLGVFGSSSNKPKSYIDEVMRRMQDDK